MTHCVGISFSQSFPRKIDRGSLPFSAGAYRKRPLVKILLRPARLQPRSASPLLELDSNEISRVASERSNVVTRKRAARERKRERETRRFSPSKRGKANCEENKHTPPFTRFRFHGTDELPSFLFAVEQKGKQKLLSATEVSTRSVCCA